jgi:hypothetical protein
VDEKKPSLIEQIDDALQCVTDRFVRQCTYGAQTKSLAAEFAACGQFIGDDAEAIEQHGLHGIAAALRVLGPCQSQDCRSLVYRIVAYCEANFGIHPTLPKPPDLDKRTDTENVIKLGELLYGLSFVRNAQAECDRLVKHVSAKLIESLIVGNGWGYFLDDGEPQLLPTAYAARGLAAHGYEDEVAAPRKFLLDGLTAKGSSSNSEAADLTTAVACTYCVTFSRIVGSHDAALRSGFRSAWRSLEPLLAENIEQNLEYWHGKDTHYVRIPWQLYLLALSSEYSLWRFGGFRAQRRLRNVIVALQSGSFKYPYSGKYLSSRTYAVAYDALAAIRTRIRAVDLLRAINVIDRVLVFAGARAIRLAATGLVLVLVFCSFRQWLHMGKLSDVAPELLASFIALVLAWARR